MTAADVRTGEAPEPPAKGLLGSEDRRFAWLIISPGMLLLFVLMIVPFGLAIWFSLTNQRLISPLPTRFVGLENYVEQFTDPLFWKSFWNNFRFAAFVVPVQTGLALLLAVLVNQKIGGRVFYRTIFFMPVTVVMAAAAVIWVLLFNPNGLINAGIEAASFGAFGGPDWLQSTTWAIWAIIIVSIWQGVGFQMVILLAALQDVPEELYEAASIDGASTWQQFRYVTIPGIRNALIFVLTVTTILSFRLFDQPTIMPRAPGGPLDSTRTTMVHMVDLGFGRQAIGRGSAVAVIFFLIVLLITVVQRRFLREEES